jgi:hypothetical protein
METAALLVVLAIVGGFVVVRTVFRDESRARNAAADERSVQDEPAERTGFPSSQQADPIELPPAGRRRRRLLTAAALTDALALDGEEELLPSFFGRTLAFGRLLLVILFICAVTGGALFWMAMMIATKAHINPG